jgi:ribosomal protein S18 acetylase RimI-like enzyme
MEIEIRLLKNGEERPIELMLLADPSLKKIREYSNSGQCYTAKYKDETIGVFVLKATHPATIEIMNIAVREDFQGKGIGKKLIQYAIEKAKEQNAKTLVIGTGNSSIYQLLLYQKCGFRITGIDRDYFTREYEEEIYENGIQCRDMIRLSMEL